MERLAHLADQVHDAAIALEQLLFASIVTTESLPRGRFKD